MPAENEPGYVTVEDTTTGEVRDLSADAVILAMGVTPRTELVNAFKDAFDNVCTVGDARQGGRIATAIREGFEAAYLFRA
jgi:thioredoxin reductase